MSENHHRNTWRRRAKQTLALFCAIGIWTTSSSVHAENTTDELSPDQQPIKQILVVTSYHLAHKRTSQMVQSFREHMDADPSFRVILSMMEMDSIREMDPSVREQGYLKLLSNATPSTPFDLILTLDDEALDMVMAHADKLSPDVPVVFSGYEADPGGLRRQHEALTGVRQPLGLEKAVQLGIHLFPHIKEVAILGDRAQRSEFHLAQAERTLPTDFPAVKFHFLRESAVSMPKLSEQVKNLPDDALLILLPRRILYSNTYASVMAADMDLLLQSPCPVLMMDDSLLGYGILGSVITDVEQQSQLTAELALRVLNGENAGHIPFVSATLNMALDETLVHKLRIPEENIPPGTQLIHHTPTLLEAHREFFQLLIAAILLALCLLGTVTFLTLKTRHRMIRIFKLLPGRIVVFSRDEKVLFINDPMMAEITKTMPKNLREFELQDHTLVSEAIHQVFETGKSVQLEYRFHNNVRTMVVSLLPYGIFNQDAVGTYSTDESELNAARRQAEVLAKEKISNLEAIQKATVALQETHERFQTACEITHTVWLLANLETMDLVDCSPNAGDIWPFVNGKVPISHAGIFPEDREAMETRFRQLVRGEIQSYTVTFRLNTRDGLHYYRATNRIERSEDGSRYVFGILRDVTEITRIGTELQQSQTLWSLAIDNLAIHLFVKDADADFRFVSVNSAFCTFYDRTESEIIGKTAREILGNQQSAHAAESQMRDWNAMQNPLGMTYTQSAQDIHGETHVFHMQLRPFNGSNGEHFLMGTATDITELTNARRRAEEHARWFEMTLNSIGDGVITTDAKGRIINLNPIAERMLGVKQEEAVGKPHEHFFHINSALDGRPMPSPVTRTLRTGTTVEMANHTDLISRTGQTYHIADSSAPILDDTHHVVGAILVFRDVTEEYAKRDDLQNALTTLEYASELTHSAYFELDPKTHAMHGSKMLPQLWPVKDGIAISRADWIHPDDFPNFQKLSEELFSGKREDMVTSYRVRTKNEVRYFRLRASRAGNPVTIIGVIQDITEITRSAGKLKNSQDLWELIINTVPFFFFAKYADQDFRYALSNDAFASFVGLPAAAVPGKTDAELFQRPEDADGFRQKDLEVMQKNEPQVFMETPVDCHGNQRTLRTTKIPFLDADGRPLLLGATVDLTELTRIGAEKDALQEQLQQAYRMESIGRIAGGIAHDFNNMLQGILGYTEMALESVPADSPAHEDIAAIEKAARHSTLLTSSLLTFARRQSTKPERIDLNDFLGTEQSILKTLVTSPVSITYTLAPVPAPVYMDPTQLERILTNLCVNARDALQERENPQIQISIECIVLEEPLQTRTGTLAPGPYSRLTVSDNGCGIPDTAIQRLFEPFFTTKKERGTGLGLAITYGVVRQAKGEIEVLSRPGVGTTFHLYFPAIESATAVPASSQPPSPVSTPAAPAAVPPPPPSSLPENSDKKPEVSPPVSREILVGKHILLVDDEATIRSSTCRILERLGCTVLVAEDGAQALELFKNPNSKVDFILSDVLMPNMTGPELVEEIRKTNPDIAYLYMSGYTDNLLKGISNDPSLSHYIQKPFSLSTLANRLAEFFLPPSP